MAIQKMPLVTVYIPTYNRLPLLKRAVKSVLGQCYKEIEVIIVDDCSRDGTREYLKQLPLEDSRVRVHLKERNGGACESRNIAIDMAKGFYMTGLDDDDYFTPDRISSFMSHVVKLDDYEFLSAKILRLKNGVVKRSCADRLKSGAYSFSDMLGFNIAGNQIFTKTEVFREKKFDPETKVWQDFELWLKILSPNKKFWVVDSFSYVVDSEHGGDRITSKQTSQVLKTYANIVRTHGLDWRDEQLLSLQLVFHGLRPSVSGGVRMLFNRPSLLNIYQLLFTFFAYMRNAVFNRLREG